MTIELQLPPELESFAQTQAMKQHHGNIAAFINDLLRQHMALDSLDGEIEKQLLEAVDAPSVPLTDAIWEGIRHRALAGTNPC